MSRPRTRRRHPHSKTMALLSKPPARVYLRKADAKPRSVYMRGWRARNPEKARAYNHKYRAANPDKVAAWQREAKRRRLARDPTHRVARALRERYGMTIEDRRALHFAQSGKCALCHRPIQNNAHIDHDHTSNRVRGMLCSNCSHGLGLFHDDATLMRRAADYVEKHRVVA